MRYECMVNFYFAGGETLAPGSVVDESAMSPESLALFVGDGRLVPTDKPLSKQKPEAPVVLGKAVDTKGKHGEGE